MNLTLYRNIRNRSYALRPVPIASVIYSSTLADVVGLNHTDIPRLRFLFISFCFSAFALQMHKLISVIAVTIITIIISLGLFSQGALNNTLSYSTHSGLT